MNDIKKKERSRLQKEYNRTGSISTFDVRDSQLRIKTEEERARIKKKTKKKPLFKSSDFPFMRKLRSMR